MKKKIIGILVCMLLIASTSSVMLVIGQTPFADDVGVTAIEEPTSGCVSDWDDAFPVQVTIYNFGTNDAWCFKVEVEIGEVGPDGTLLPPEFDTEMCILVIGTLEEMVLDFGEWTPEVLAEELPFCKEYYVKACTKLEDPPDENTTNDCLIKIITLSYGLTLEDFIDKIDDLIAMIEGMGLNNGVKNDLIAKLNSAKGFLDPPNVNVGQAVFHLNLFLGRVTHWSTHPPSNPGLTSAQATLLTNTANQIINCLELNCFSDG